MAVNPEKNGVNQGFITKLIGIVKRKVLDLSGAVSDEETRAMAAEASARTEVVQGENCTIEKTTASDGHDVYTINADGKPQVQADWSQADSSKVDYIKNKPDLSLKEDVANKATTVRQSGSADDTHFPSEAAVRSAIDSAVSAAYKAAGTKRAAELTSSLLVAANEGNVYNITEAGTTDNNFVDGAGKTINVGDNVGVCKVGNDYKFDLLSGFLDLSDYVQKSDTAGLLKNDGTVDTSDYLTKTGDGSNVTITPDGSTGTTFSSGDKLSALAQKFINLVSSLKALAFKDKVSDGDIDGVISASHIPDAIKDKIVYIDGTITSSDGSYSVSCNTTYAQVAAMVDPSVGKYPICRFTLGSQIYYFMFHLGVPSGSHLRYTFGSTDVYSGSGTVSFMTSVYVEPDDVWKFREITYDPSSWTAALNGKADKTPTFSEASTRLNLAGSNESMTTILGKIKKWFADLNALAFKDTASYSDLSSGVKSSLDKADSALQSSSVDQSYNASSTNPQSGTAVAQALYNNAVSQNAVGYGVNASTIREGDWKCSIPNIMNKKVSISIPANSTKWIKIPGGAVAGELLNIGFKYGSSNCYMTITVELSERSFGIESIKVLNKFGNPALNGGIQRICLSQNYDGGNGPWLYIKVTNIDSVNRDVNIASTRTSDITYELLDNTDKEIGVYVEITRDGNVLEQTQRVIYNGMNSTYANGQVGSPTRPVYAKSDGSLEACNFNAAAFHIFNDGIVEDIPDYVFTEYNQFIIKDSSLRIYAEQLVENICYKFYNYKGNYCKLSFSTKTNNTYTRVWNSSTSTISKNVWADRPSLSRPTSGICIVVRIGNAIYVSGY